MGLVLVPADAEVDSVIFRLRATDQDADFPLVFEITATITPVVRIDNLPCTLYNKVCQANVILTKRLMPGRLHDFAVRVRDTKGDSNSMQATISVTNATTLRDKIFPHIPSLIMVPEDTKPGKELDYLLVRANSWSGKPVYIELWQPKELFTIRQRQTPTQTRGIITLTGELDFETQSMYTLTMYATDPYTEQGKDTRNIAGLSVVVIVQDVQDVPPIFTLAPPLTRINNSVQPGDIILRVHAEDGDKGVPREIVYGLVSEGNPFTPFFNISETNGEITLAKPLEELTQITHVGAPVVLTVVAEEIRRSREEPPAQATVVDVGFLLGEPGNSPPYFESDKLVPESYVATIDENPEPGTVINFGEQYSARVKDEDIGKAGVFALKLENNNNTFEINPTVAERNADFVITVRDNTFIDYELYKVLSFKIVAQEVGPATNLSASVPATIFLRDINDNPPIFDEQSYEITLSENVTAGSRVIQVHATDKDTGVYGSIRYTGITGEGSQAFTMDSDTGLITVAMGSSLDREVAARLVLTVEARDENGNGNSGVVPLIVNLLDVNDNAPIFEKDVYEFMLNSDLTNFTSPALIKAIDADAEPPNNVVRYELVYGNYGKKFDLNETSGELILLLPITKFRQKKQSAYEKFSKKAKTKFVNSQEEIRNDFLMVTRNVNESTRINLGNLTKEMSTEVIKKRRKRADDDALYTLTARAYDLGVPHLSSTTKIRILSGIAMEARIMMFVVPGEQPNSTKTAETLAAITGGRVTVLETRPYIQRNDTGSTGILTGGGKKSIIVARVEQTEPGTSLVDVEKIREALAANGVGIIAGNAIMNTSIHIDNTNAPVDETPRHTNVNDGQTTLINNTIAAVPSEEVTVYKAENKLLFWLLIILVLLILLAIAALIICCICPGCPFYMAPRKRRVHSSETLVVRSNGRPKRHLHRQPAVATEVSWNGRKQAWSADPTRRNWQFNRRNVKNCSLPGDVAYISGQPNDVQMNLEAQRLRDGHSYGHSRKSRINEQERMYMEDVEDQKARGYRTAELDSLQRHEMERGSDLQHQAYRQRFVEADMNEEPTVREQHFYREGNAEVLRLVTRGQVEDTTSHLHQPHHHRPTALIVDGKDIILQRFIEDQKSRHELSMQDIEAARSMESHQRSKEVCQQQQPEIILIPDRLDLGHRQHIEEIGPNVQRLVIDHGDYGSQKIEQESLRESQMRETMRQEKQEAVASGAPIAERPPVVTTDHVQANSSQYPFHDLELARQNALLTRLLLERENRRAGGGGVDSTSYLETQSLPGQVAIATQTDRTAATQTERQVKSRSDNDESDEESRHRKKLKSRKKYGDGDWKRSRTLWMKSPIEEEVSPCFDKRLSILRKKVREVKEGRKISLEPDVLREISDSLDGNGSSYKGEEDETMRSYQKTERTSISYKILNEKETGSQSSEEIRKERHEKSCEDVTDDQKMNVTESTSSPEIKVQREKYVREKADDRSPKKEGKSKTQKKSDGVIKPSFRILEKEFTMLTKKLSKLGDKKFQESTGSDSTSQEKSDSFAKEPKKDLDQKSAKKMDSSSSQKQAAECTASSLKAEQKGKQKKESAIAKTKQKLKYQQSQVMSTGSSEFDDALDKPKKFCGTRHETVKQKQPISTQGHAKVKRQTHMERREPKKQMSEFRDEEVEKRKEGPSKETPKAELKSERIGKMMIKAPKLGTISRKQNIAEETSTSTEERRGGRDAFAPRDFEKKSSTEFSEGDSNGVQQRVVERFPKKIIEKFSDDFVEEPKKETVKQQATISTGEERDTTNVEKHKIVTEKELCIPDTIQVSKNGLKWIRDTFEEPVKCDDSTAHAKEELIRGFTAIDTMAATKKEELSETIVRDRQTDKTSPEKEPMESIKYSDTAEKKESTQTDKLTSEAEKDIAEHIKDKLEDYKEEDKSLDESKEQIEMIPVRELEERKQDDKEDDKYEYLEQKMKKLSKDVGEESVVLKELKRAEVEYRAEGISTGREEAEKELEVEVDALKEEERSDKVGTVQKIEEPIEKYIETEMPSNGQDSVRQDVADESKIRGKKDKTDKANGEEEKSVKHVDGSKLDHATIEEKEGPMQATSSDQEKKKIDSDTIEVPREKETTSMNETYDRKVEENVFLDEQKKYDEDDTRIKPVDQIVESTFVDEDKEGISDKNEVMVKATTEDDKAVEKASEDYKITEKVTEDQKFDKKIMDDRKIFPEATMDQEVGREINKDQKIDEQAREIDQITREETFGDPKIIEEATKDQKMDKEITEGQKVDKETTKFTKMDTGMKEDDKILDKTSADHKIIAVTGDKKTSKETTDLEIAETVIPDDKIVIETTEDRKIDEKAAEGYKISKEAAMDKEMTKSTTTDYQIGKDTKDDDDIAGEPTADQKIDKETKDDDDIAGEPTADQKIDKETKDDDDIARESTADQKIGKETKDDNDIAGEPTADQKIGKEIKDDDDIAGEPIADQKIGKETKDDDDIAGEPTADQKIDKKTKDDDDVAGEPIADQKIGKETKDDDDIAGEPIADQKLGKETRDDDDIAGEPIADQKIIETVEKQDTEETKYYETVEKATEDFKITEPEATYHKLVEKTTEDHTSIGDLGILTETIVDFIGKEKASDGEKKISMEIDKDKVSEKEAIFLDKEKVPGEQAGTTDLKSDDQQIDKEDVLNGKEKTVDITPDNENEKRKSSSPKEKETSAKKEVTKEPVTSDDHKISERDVSIDTKEETRVEDEKEIVKSEETKEQASIIDDEEKEKYHDKEEKIIIETVKIDDHPIEEKEISKGMQKIDDSEATEKESTETEETDDSQIPDEEIVPETSEIKQQITIEKQDDTSTIQDYQIDKEVIPMKIPHDTTEEKDDSSKRSITEKQDSEITKDSIEMPTLIDSDMKEESPMESSAVDDHTDKTVDVFDTLTNGKGSIIPSTEKEIATIEQSSTNDRIIEKEVASLSFDNKEEKEKNGVQISNISKSPTPQTDGESGTLVEPPVDDKQTKENAGKDKIIDLSDDDKIISTSKDAAEKVEQINVLEEAKGEESDEKIKIDDSSRDEATKLVAEESVEKSEIGKPLKDETASPAKERQDTAKELFEKTHEVSKEPEKLSNNETADSKLARTTEKVEQLREPSGKVSSSFQEIELVETSPQMYETTEKEKFAFDSTIRKASTDSGKISESEEQLKSESEQTELQEVEQFVEEQTFTAEEADIQREAFPEEQSNMGFNVPTIVPNGESDKQDLTKPKMDKTLPLEEDIVQEERQEIPVEGKFIDVSLPLFTSIIDTVVDSEDSDSSSDISRKTTLTTRPYQTPRHRAPQLSEKEISQTEEATGLQDMEDEERVTISIEEIENEDVESSKEEQMFVEFEDTSETEEDKETVLRERTMDIQTHFSPKKIITATDIEDMKKDEKTESGCSLELTKESSISTKLESGTKECDTKADRQDEARDKECSTSTKHVKDTKIDSETRGYDRKPDRQDEVREKESSTSTQRVKDTELEHEMKDGDKKVDKPDEPSIISKLAKTETFKVTDRRMKELEKKRVIQRRKKKSTSEESSEEKATHFHDVTSHSGYRTRRKLPEEQLKQKDSDQTKQSRKRDEESRRKQSLSKLKAEKDKKSSSSSEKYPTPPKTGEIDTSKTRPKYMAWYKKNREEMEKKRAELMATDDEEQLPRWLRRSMKNQKTEKEGKKLSSHKTADTTPRTRRKVKPLVNVESEQLKAIVRQGRKLRRAEGGKNEDPPVQIFATTPPSTSQDPKYHLLQHSEYKYEKISAPFYLHPPPVPHPSPQLSPEHFDIPPTMEQGCTGEDFDSGIAISLQGGNRLRHQQLLEKKSVFDIAYSEAAPSQLRSDSTTPPS
ncbi:uncharacterized protein LOC117231937 [Bombus vosnesenskii]|uniref:Uncharacterized protein LOC117231937 n=1 Tax=Bombus vosnesenskii TaxID=207650 RepID=A0A6J3K174_9HYME|nr:uncharacterized protein LOC117231937 [Bombus vosnesenskii]